MYVRQVVRVVDVCHRPPHHCRRQIGEGAAVGVEIDLQRCDDTIIRECDFVVVLEWMPAAGDAHVIVFVVRDARRTLHLVRDERCHRRRMRGLALFSAERAAHPFRCHHDFVDRQA